MKHELDWSVDMEDKIPPYIPAANLQHLPLTPQWDDSNPYPLIGKNNESTEQLLSRISNYGKFVFSLGCAEWVVARLNKHLENDRPWQYLDACWAFAVSPLFSLPIELDDREWLGPVLGPICLALTTVINTRYGFDEDNAEIDSAFAEKIALHVMPNKGLFKQWRDITLQRMLDLCSVDIEDPTGKRLPRDVLDPHSTIEVHQLSSLLPKTLAGLTIDSNPFVNKVD
jgi:hypothetical protein